MLIFACASYYIVIKCLLFMYSSSQSQLSMFMYMSSVSDLQVVMLVFSKLEIYVAYISTKRDQELYVGYSL